MNLTTFKMICQAAHPAAALHVCATNPDGTVIATGPLSDWGNTDEETTNLLIENDAWVVLLPLRGGALGAFNVFTGDFRLFGMETSWDVADLIKTFTA